MRRVAAISTQQLAREFEGGIVAVDGVDLEVAEGEIYGFLGPNGAGKTTTVRMLTTLLAPTGGRAIVAGHDVAEDPGAVRRKIGVALQEAALDPLMTGRELIHLQATLHGHAAEPAAASSATRCSTASGLTQAADRRVGTYSGGMRRRLDLAAALVPEPSVLFLDEPTTGLDPVSRQAIWEEVSKLNDEGTTVFLTTQYLEEADQLADRVGIITDGKLVAEGTPAALKAEVGKPHLELSLAGRTARLSSATRSWRASASCCPSATASRWSSSSAGPPTSARSSARSTRRAWRSSRSTWSSRPSTTCSSPRPAATSRATTTSPPERGGRSTA